MKPLHSLLAKFFSPPLHLQFKWNCDFRSDSCMPPFCFVFLIICKCERGQFKMESHWSVKFFISDGTLLMRVCRLLAEESQFLFFVVIALLCFNVFTHSFCFLLHFVLFSRHFFSDSESDFIFHVFQPLMPTLDMLFRYEDVSYSNIREYNCWHFRDYWVYRRVFNVCGFRNMTSSSSFSREFSGRLWGHRCFFDVGKETRAWSYVFTFTSIHCPA